MFAYLMFADPGQNRKAQTVIPRKHFWLYGMKEDKSHKNIFVDFFIQKIYAIHTETYKGMYIC